jgi:HPt (histidine-containing phosphotransfer) domain-containing protein
MSDFATALDDLVRRFHVRTAQDRQRLVQLAERIDADKEAVTEIRFIAHRLAGSAGTFGFARLSGPAGALDDLISGGSREAGSIREHVGQLVTAIDAG